MAPQIAVSVSLSSLQWSVTRERADKLAMVINVVEKKQHPFSGSPKLDDALLFTPRQLCTEPSTKLNFLCGVILLDFNCDFFSSSISYFGIRPYVFLTASWGFRWKRCKLS